MSENISPEERLFRVIQQGKLTAGQGRGVPEQKPAGGFEGFRRFIASQIARIRIPDWKKISEWKKIFDWKKGSVWEKIIPDHIRWPELEPQNINRVLTVVLAVILICVACAAFGKHKDVAAIVSVAESNKILPEESKKGIEPLKEVSFYLSAIQNRDIFHASAKAPVVENVRKASETLMKSAESLKLQGVSWGDVPKAMILWQNGKESKMYFLVEDQAIGTTGLKVVKISRGAVKIGNGKEEMVLS